MPSFKPKDLVALVTLIGIFFLKSRGLDGQIDIAAALILGYYFAHRRNGDDNGR